MAQEKKEKQKYFEEALSDFTHDVASGRAIRHLVDLGYTTEQIMQEISYPTPRGRVEQTVARYLKESGVLLEELPVSTEKFQRTVLKNAVPRQLYTLVRTALEKNGEENSYVLCPFGTIRRDRELRLRKMLTPLTGRERDYLLGIAWDMRPMYHRLTSRMVEIGVELAAYNGEPFCFCFLRSEEIICNIIEK